jgi:hemoglobin-like flavoprotein
MKTENIELVKKSWKLIEQMDKEVVGGMFYRKLFQLAPGVKPLFSNTTMVQQAAKLVTMLTYIIDHVDRLDVIIADVASLSKRHVNYGVKDEDYLAVGQALLWTLNNAFGKYWNEDFQNAWTEVYVELSAAMISLAEEPLT